MEAPIHVSKGVLYPCFGKFRTIVDDDVDDSDRYTIGTTFTHMLIRHAAACYDALTFCSLLRVLV